MKRIEKDFSNNEVAKNILLKAIDKRLANIINTAKIFLLELNEDIKSLNQSINCLTEHGQIFIENHLKQFHLIESPSEVIRQIEDKTKQEN